MSVDSATLIRYLMEKCDSLYRENSHLKDIASEKLGQHALKAENSIRPVAVGRRNYLFCGNDDAAEDAAVIYSFMGCCKAAGADFRTWLVYFLDHVHDYDNDYTKDLAELLPDNLKATGKL